MLFIPVGALKEGMVLAKDINCEISSLPLLARGQVLNENYIKKLQSMNIMGVYVESRISGDIRVDCVLDADLKKEALITVKRTFEDFSRVNKFTCTMAESIVKIAEKLVLDITSNDKILINLIDLKGYDDYTYRHSLCVSIIAIALGFKLGFNLVRLTRLAISALLHDIGKMSISKDILNKPAKLTLEEFEIIKTHPHNGVLRLERIGTFSESTLDGIESHHERFDGNGYPKKLRGSFIPLFGRILAVADVYDALTSDRPYRSASFPSDVIEYMMGNCDALFDHDILNIFLKLVVIYPVGMLVNLSNGQTAVVVKNNEENPLRPVIRLFASDGTDFMDIDLLNNKEYYNLTISGMGYGDNCINYDVLID